MRSVTLSLLLLFAALALSGCAYSMISQNALRTEPFENVLDRTLRARGIALDRPVDARVVSRDELAGVLEAAFHSQWSEPEIRQYQRSLTAIGLWPAERDLLGESMAVMGEEVSGLYVPTERALYVVADARTPFWVRLLSALARRDLMMELTLAHEIVHFLQHGAYPDLMDRDLLYRDQDDLVSAIQAAIEGDATRYGLQALDPAGELPAPSELDAAVEAEIAGAAGEALAAAPALIRLTVAFPYTKGYRLASEEGEQLLERPPASTEQVLHADKRHESFAVFDLSDLEDALPEACGVLWANTVGELGLSVLFRDLGEGLASSVWQGWDGDRYLAAECGEGLQFLWITAWDSEADAAEFEVGYRGIAAAVADRARLAAVPELLRLGREVYVSTDRLTPLRAILRSRVRRGRASELGELRDRSVVLAPR